MLKSQTAHGGQRITKVHPPLPSIDVLDFWYYMSYFTYNFFLGFFIFLPFRSDFLFHDVRYCMSHRAHRSVIRVGCQGSCQGTERRCVGAKNASTTCLRPPTTSLLKNTTTLGAQDPFLCMRSKSSRLPYCIYHQPTISSQNTQCLFSHLSVSRNTPPGT